jgi:hypothetical protein
VRFLVCAFGALDSGFRRNDDFAAALDKLLRVLGLLDARLRGHDKNFLSHKESGPPPGPAKAGPSSPFQGEGVFRTACHHRCVRPEGPDRLGGGAA